ncbi:MAG: hypothetical protein K0R98_745 [Rickettsiaceae bacterium]|jgi:hypothetical protein|nr:hypothetical protein [Rickettsiaceae bacterium]
MSRELLARAMDDCLNHLGVDAVYTGIGIPPVNIRVLKFASDIEYEAGDTVMVGETARFELLVSDVERPLPNDTITINTIIYQVYGEPLRNIERGSWDVKGVVIPA